ARAQGLCTACAFAGYFVHHLPLYSVLPQAKGLRHQSSSWCRRLSRPPTTTPYPPLPEASGFRWGLPCLLPTPLRILQEASRVRCGRLKRHDVGGVLLAFPIRALRLPSLPPGYVRLTWSAFAMPPLLWPLLVSRSLTFGCDWLAS